MPAYFIGVDEAGYGPNLGPLVVTATAWQLADNHLETDFYELLDKVVTRPSRFRRQNPFLLEPDLRLKIGDSKTLYSGSSDLYRLEHPICCLLATLDPLPATLEAAWETMAPGSLQDLARCPWHDNRPRPFPHTILGETIVPCTNTFQEESQRSKLRLMAIRSRAIFPERWNQLLDEWGGKANVLSRTTLALVKEVMEELPGGPRVIQCDKHGGRNRYVTLLQDTFPEIEWEVIRESRELSRYRGGSATSYREFRFARGGEEHLTVALASMISKYLRELAMQDFNAFWCSRIENLKPTAGYPVDARRFHDEIALIQRQLQVPDAILWRNK